MFKCLLDLELIGIRVFVFQDNEINLNMCLSVNLHQRSSFNNLKNFLQHCYATKHVCCCSKDF